ncbi:transcription factor EMB1444-like isoform X1 [Senna tora]|uniref:Transcription factor EMB1444-like isoform X1 n=1 Tax=Senna tora TaxID=362788 RepID=A0A834XHY3_9FABA|nr:transcription factor EMB1444-like isoform X1 [Senna tora]
METMSIKQLLKSLCHYTQWNYVVFWKLNHYLPMSLSWEDGYCNYQKENEAVESMHCDITFEDSNDLFSSSIESNGASEAFSLRLLMTEMSNLKYSLGEGIVGKIALKGEHCWVFSEDIFTSNFNTDLISECPYEWLLQFSSGIKAVLLVPVLPHGVLQFGSFQAVAKDMEFVTNVKEKFSSLYCKLASDTLSSSDIAIQSSSFSAPTDRLMDNLDESSSISNNKLKAKLSGNTSLDINGSTRLYPMVPSCIQDECHTYGKVQLESLKKEKSENISPYIGVLSDPRHIGPVDMILNQMENRICSYSIKDMTEQQFGSAGTGHKNCQDVDSLFEFSLDSELYRALGPDASGQTAESLKEGDAEYLLDAVVRSLDTSFSITNGVMPHITLPREYTALIPPQSRSEESTLIVDYSEPENHLTPTFMVEGRDDFSNLVSSTSSDGNSSILIDETQQKVNGNTQPDIRHKLSCIGKKRGRVGNTEKPRPRDRQLIMDRMKELRELIPDGARCSIDNLLDRTVKHMLYLQNITKQAEKLKQCLLQEVPDCKKQKINGSHAGRTCAFDLESEHQVCPLIVEDLGCSGNLLIEMICSEAALFLEIVSVIQRMELTIMKGVLESRSSTYWASFIVEVPRGFHRMDILCPLLHLLQLRTNPNSASNTS